MLCDLEDPRTEDLVTVAPRTVLRRQLEGRGRIGLHGQRGLRARVLPLRGLLSRGSREEIRRDAAGVGTSRTTTSCRGAAEEFYNAQVRRHLSASGIPVENSKGEWGRGQHEMNIRFTDVLDMADRHTMMKQAMKEIADSTGVSITFMAKPDMSEAGSSCHLHVSLWAGDDNAFPGDEVFGPVHGSDEFRWFLGGWMAHVPELMVFYAPTINSYKRYQDGSWAPTRLGWSYDNRTAGFRVVGHGESLRIECRIPGADTNPYLAYAAVLASGLDGITNKIEAPEIFSRRRLSGPGDPPGPVHLA